jgi:hypothetical protein
MENRKVLEHTCFQKEHPLSPVRCRCRKYVTTEIAAKLIAEGSAQYVVKRWQDVISEEQCIICNGDDKLVRSCPACFKTGRARVLRQIPVFGEDIITSVGERGKRLTNTTAKKTPRSPTIESNHILRAIGAVGGGQHAARDRWDEYEMLTLKERIRLLSPMMPAKLFDAAWSIWEDDPSLPFPFVLNTEPENNLSQGTGRQYDYGRSI